MVQGVGRNVYWLGAVSFFADVAGEMIAPLLPLYITTVLGAAPTAVGLVEGAAELAASVFRGVGGWWSDRAGARKPTVVLGYALSAAAKPALALAAGWPGLLVARFADRTGKGLRGAARDALIASSTDRAHLGKAFGLHRAMDTAGAVAGPLIGLWLLSAGLSYRSIFLWAGLPAFAAVAVLVLFVRDVKVPGKEPARERLPSTPLSSKFWRFLAVYGLFALGNSSDAFVLLKGRDAGMSATTVVLAYVLFNVVNAACATAIGHVADRVGRRLTVAAGMGVYSLCYLGFARATTAEALWPLFALYGLQAALIEGSFRAAVADASEPGNRGLAQGVFQGTAGVLAFTASALAGLMWTRISPSAPFYFGAACSAAAAVLLPFSVWRSAGPTGGGSRSPGTTA
ncbi:MAG: MFS transporter [Elusimicrobia bacterium]|nr:MFS transporter [Elusimicrobiota bacterium]